MVSGIKHHLWDKLRDRHRKPRWLWAILAADRSDICRMGGGVMDGVISEIGVEDKVICAERR